MFKHLDSIVETWDFAYVVVSELIILQSRLSCQGWKISIPMEYCDMRMLACQTENTHCSGSLVVLEQAYCYRVTIWKFNRHCCKNIKWLVSVTKIIVYSVLCAMTIIFPIHYNSFDEDCFHTIWNPHISIMWNSLNIIIVEGFIFRCVGSCINSASSFA